MADNCDSGKCPPSEDPLDAKTFTPPVRDSQGSSPTPSIVIEVSYSSEYDACKTLPLLTLSTSFAIDVAGFHRATWVQTELFLTFPDTQAEEASDGKEPGGKYATAGKGIKAITLIPCNAPDTGGRFRVWLYIGERSSTAQQQQQQRDNGNSKSREGVYEGWEGGVALGSQDQRWLSRAERFGEWY